MEKKNQYHIYTFSSALLLFTYPGKKVAVNIIFVFHDSPPFILYKREDTNPEIKLNTINKMIITVANAPRFEGERKPRTAKTINYNIIKLRFHVHYHHHYR